MHTIVNLHTALRVAWTKAQTFDNGRSDGKSAAYS